MARPSKYSAAYTEHLIAHMAQGLSFESFAGAVGVHRDTLYQWAKDHQEFSDAKKRGYAACLLFYERLGLDGVMGRLPKFNPTTWIFSMKCRFRDAGWHDRPADDAMAETGAAELDTTPASQEELVLVIKRLCNRN